MGNLLLNQQVMTPSDINSSNMFDLAKEQLVLTQEVTLDQIPAPDGAHATVQQDGSLGGSLKMNNATNEDDMKVELEAPAQKSERAQAAKADGDAIIEDSPKKENDEGEGYQSGETEFWTHFFDFYIKKQYL